MSLMFGRFLKLVYLIKKIKILFAFSRLYAIAKVEKYLKPGVRPSCWLVHTTRAHHY